MISAHMLHTVSRILQFCKSNESVMGEIQRVFCGDFLQLPPIANEMSNDIGEPAILSPEFSLYAPHKVHLQKVSTFRV